MTASGEARDSASFYDRHWERTDTAADPHVVAKGERILAMVPKDFHTLLDIGCGDGYLTHVLAQRYEVTACDRSAVALQRVRVPSIQASADALPVPDRSFDMVFSSQLLEHLPDDVLVRATREIARAARRYIFISVPDRENLRRRFVLCDRCGLEFNLDGHLQSFDAAALDRLFADYERIAVDRGGPMEPPTFAPIERLRQRVCNHWFFWSGMHASCPRCGRSELQAPRRNVLHYMAEGVLNAAAAAWRLGSRAEARPYWLMALYQRRGAS